MESFGILVEILAKVETLLQDGETQYVVHCKFHALVGDLDAQELQVIAIKVGQKEFDDLSLGDTITLGVRAVG